MTNLDELLLGCDPHLPDTDGDGIPDGEERRIGTNPTVADAFADPDGDGLANIDEWKAGTDVRRPDTDGDGCPDGIEVTNVRSNPLVPDIFWNSPVACEGSFDVRETVRTTGTWRTADDGSIYAAERAGSLTWRLAVPAGGADALAVRLVQHEFFSRAAEFDISLSVDGVFVCRQTVRAP